MLVFTQHVALAYGYIQALRRVGATCDVDFDETAKEDSTFDVLKMWDDLARAENPAEDEDVTLDADELAERLTDLGEPLVTTPHRLMLGDKWYNFLVNQRGVRVSGAFNQVYLTNAPRYNNTVGRWTNHGLAKEHARKLVLEHSMPAEVRSLVDGLQEFATSQPIVPPCPPEPPEPDHIRFARWMRQGRRDQSN